VEMHVRVHVLRAARDPADVLHEGCVHVAPSWVVGVPYEATATAAGALGHSTPDAVLTSD
jgi:hypothetical protein